MSNCNDKIKHRCKKVYSDCVSYDKDLHEISELTDCISIADTTEELYNLIGEVKTDIDLTDLESECLTLPTDRSVKNMFQFLFNTICTMKEEIETLQEDLTTAQEQIQDLQTNTCP